MLDAPEVCIFVVWVSKNDNEFCMCYDCHHELFYGRLKSALNQWSDENQIPVKADFADINCGERRIVSRMLCDE
jgi:hypothetical protein